MSYRSKFRVYLSEFRATDLPSKDRSGFSDPFLVCNFDHFKKFKTKTAKRTLNPEWKGFSMEFTYETRYLDRLRDKFFRINCYDKDRILSNDYIGCVDVDLHTLCTGPTRHRLVLRNNGQAGGNLFFSCKMSQISDVTVTFWDVALHNLPPTARDGSTSIRLTYSYSGSQNDKKFVTKTIKAKFGEKPKFKSMAQVVIPDVTLHQMITENFRFAVRQHHRRNQKSLCDAVLELREYLNVAGQSVRFVEPLVDIAQEEQDAKADAAAVPHIVGEIHFSNCPLFGNMIGGLHTDTEIVGGRCLVNHVEVPIGLGWADDPEKRRRRHRRRRRRKKLMEQKDEEESKQYLYLYARSKGRQKSGRFGHSTVNFKANAKDNVDDSGDEWDVLADSDEADLHSRALKALNIEMRKHNDGRTFFVDNNEEETYWKLPNKLQLQVQSKMEELRNESMDALSRLQASMSVGDNGDSGSDDEDDEDDGAQQREEEEEEEESDGDGDAVVLPSQIPPPVSTPTLVSRQQRSPLVDRRLAEEKNRMMRRSNLPTGWEKRTNRNGREFYVDHNSGVKHWADRFPIQSGWEERVSQTGRLVYINHSTRQTTWDRPVDVEQIMKLVRPPNPNPLSGSKIAIGQTMRRKIGPLPPGWDAKLESSTGRIVYINLVERKTQWNDPRLEISRDSVRSAGDGGNWKDIATQ